MIQILQRLQQQEPEYYLFLKTATARRETNSSKLSMEMTHTWKGIKEHKILDNFAVVLEQFLEQHSE